MISTITSLVLTTTLPTLANTTSTLSSSIHYNVTQPFHIFNNIGETSNNATIANVVDNVIANVNGNVVNGTVLLSASSSLDNPFYNLTGNETTTYQQPVFPNYIRVTSMVFCIIIMCLGVIGNVMVPIVILKTKDMRNSTNIFLMNLSVADLMVLLVCTPTVLVEVNTKPETWVLGEEMCKAVPFVEFTVAHASVLTILAISFERYYAICEPLRAGYVCTKARASLICLLAWFFAAICTSPILVVAKYQFEEYYDGSMVPVCWTSADTFWKAFFFIITIFVFFFIPLAILIILYTMIAKTLMEHPSILCPPKSNQVPPHTAMKYRKQVTLMLGTVVLGFFICLLPFKAFTLCVIVFPPEMILSVGFEARYNILYFCKIMVHLNSAINPILYNLMSSKFREGFLRLCGFGKKRAKKLRKRDHFGRKNTFNNTSTSNSITNTTDSFWRRYSNRNTSQKSVTVHSTPIRVPNQVTSDILEDTEEELSTSIRNNNMKHSYVRVPFTSGGSQKRTIVQNGESFV